MSKTVQHLEEYVFNFLDRIIIDIQTYEEFTIKMEDLNPFSRLYDNAILHYFILSLRNLIDKKGDEKSSVPIFLKLFEEQIFQCNPTFLNNVFIRSRLEAKMQQVRERAYFNKYFAHLSTSFLADIILWEEKIPNIEEVVLDLKEIIWDFMLLVYWYNWILQKRKEINIWII